MEWLGFTTQHLTGIVAMLLFFLLVWWFRRTSKNFDDSAKSIIIAIIIITAFVLTMFYGFYLLDNPNEIIKLF